MPRQSIRFLFLLACLAGLSSVGWGQRSPSTTRPAEIHGQVRLPDGRPAPTGVAISLEMSGGGAAGQTQTDQSGKFSFQQVPQAVYEVHVRAVGYQADPQVVDLTTSHSTYLTFILRDDASHKGPGGPAVPPEGPGATISLADQNAPEGARKDLASAQQLLSQGKDLNKSIQLLKKAVTEYPNYAQAYLLMGVAYSSQHKWNDAVEPLQKSIALDQNNSSAYVALGSVENERKNFSEAEKYLTKAVQLSPESPDAQFELGRAYWGLSRWDEAGQHVAKANQLRPDNAGQHILMGNIFLRERNAEGALKEFQDAVRLDPKGPLAEPTRQMIAKIQAALSQAQKK